MSIERKDNITIVSGYWPVHNKYTQETYCKWFQNTLKIINIIMNIVNYYVLFVMKYNLKV